MPTSFKVLGQVATAATTDTTLYTVPSVAATEAVISTLIVANRAGTATTYRIAIRPNGDTLADLHFIAFDVAIGPADSTTLTLGLTLNAADVITVRGANENLTFSVFGSEVTA